MNWYLFLDDERYPPQWMENNNYFIARNFDEAVALVQKHGMPHMISFDHDLGEEKTGYDFAKWLIVQHMDGNEFPENFYYHVHSMNPVGAANIVNFLDGFFKIIGRLINGKM